MTLPKEQVRRVAQILYPQVWLSNREEAIAKTIEYVHEVASDASNDNDAAPHAVESADGKTSAVVEALRMHMKRAHLHVNVTARAIGVSAYTVRTWLEGKYSPNETNARKIEAFLEQSQGTPEILTKDS